MELTLYLSFQIAQKRVLKAFFLTKHIMNTFISMIFLPLRLHSYIER